MLQLNVKHFKSILLISLLILLAGCAKKNTPTPKTATVSMAFTLNGTKRTTTNVKAIYNSVQKSIVVTGNLGTSEEMSLAFSSTAVGTYDLTSGLVYATYLPDLVASDAFIGSSGTLTITSSTSNSISGTFFFSGFQASLTANGTVDVTAGTFTATF